MSDLLTKKERFINREYSWLCFNERVLLEAQNYNYPLFERLKFLSISGSNLDEFITVRLAGILTQVMTKANSESSDGRTPKEQLDLIYEKMDDINEKQTQIWQIIKKELSEENIKVLCLDELSNKEQKFIETYFMKHVLASLTPIAVDASHPFPFIPNLMISVIATLVHKKTKEVSNIVITVPQGYDRFIRLPSNDDSVRFIAIEDIIRYNLKALFFDHNILESSLIKLFRNSDLEIDEKAEDLVRTLKTALMKREQGRAVHLTTISDISDTLLNFITAALNINHRQITALNGRHISLKDIIKLTIKERKDLQFEKFSPKKLTIDEQGGSIFDVLDKGDILLHHPYDSFETIINFLRQAASSKHCIVIRQTIYRTMVNSPIIDALIEAAQRGKNVTAVIELKARFDEEKNLHIAKRLEEAGVHVIFSFIKLKTHAKICHVVLRKFGKLKSYTHFGTGNYHPETAKLYTDLSLLTANKKLGQDALKLFNYMTSYAEPKNLALLRVSPINLKETIMQQIDKEIKISQDGGNGYIWIKVNSLLDSNIIDKLYEASSFGVKIELIVRGICGLRAGVKNLSENIKVYSIIGRFLEHSRIYAFGGGAKELDENSDIYISSSDLMQRNLYRRIETLVPILDKSMKKKIIYDIINVFQNDNAQKWQLNSEQSYKRVGDINGDIFSCHNYFIEQN